MALPRWIINRSYLQCTRLVDSARSGAYGAVMTGIAAVSDIFDPGRWTAVGGFEFSDITHHRAVDQLGIENPAFLNRAVMGDRKVLAQELVKWRAGVATATRDADTPSGIQLHGLSVELERVPQCESLLLWTHQVQIHLALEHPFEVF